MDILKHNIIKNEEHPHINIKQKRKYKKDTKRKMHYRGVNRSLTEAEIKDRKKQIRKLHNTQYYKNNLERLRSLNLNNYYTHKAEQKPRGRPKKYIITP
jgi:hypothetical protein